MDMETNTVIAAYEKKWSFSSFLSRGEQKTKPGDGRTAMGCIHIFHDVLPADLDELTVVTSGYCAIEAEHMKRSIIFRILSEGGD